MIIDVVDIQDPATWQLYLTATASMALDATAGFVASSRRLPAD